MAITSEQQSDILKLVTGLFNAAPGGRNLTDLANAVASGMTIPQLADYLASHPLFTHDIMAGKVTTAAQVDVLMKHFGLAADPADDTAPGSQAEFFFTARINEGVGFGAIVLEAVNFLSQENLPEEFAPTAALLNNKVLVSELYSQATPDSSADLPTLQSILTGVTAEGPSTEAEAQAFLEEKGPGGNKGETFALTVNQDILTGTTANDTFIAGLVQDGGALIQTLQDVDTINGGEGTDSINVTLLGAGAVSPTLTSVENVNVRFTTDALGDLDLSSSTGVDKVTVANSSQIGTVSGLGDTGTIAVDSQSQNVTFSGSTAADLTVSLNNVGATAATTIDLTDAAATSLTLDLNGLDESTVILTQTAATATSITVNLTGDSTVDMSAVDDVATTLNVSGTGSLTPTASLAALTELNVSGDASVDLSADPSTTLETVAASGTTGDVAVEVNGSATAIATGSGNDSVTFTAGEALAAGATVDLGDGDDNYVVGSDADDATATVEGGAGEDTISITGAMLSTITNPEIYTGFEVLAISDVLADGASIDVSGLAGFEGFKASAGVAALGTATVSGIGTDATVTLAGDLVTNNGALNVNLADASGTADSMTLMIDTLITQNNDATVDTTAATVTTSIAGVETLNVGSTGTLSTDVTAGAETDVAHNTLVLTDDALVNLNIGGDQMLTFASAASMEDLATIDASTNTAGVNINVSAAAATAAAMTITGSAVDDTITGSANADTINGGEGNDTITGGAGADALSGGAGNDIFTMLAAANSSLVNLDVISDFTANTVGQGADGAVTDAGAAASSDDWAGDVIDLSALAGALTKIDVSVQANSSDAQTFLQNLGDATADTIGVALDSSTGRLFIDVTSDGTVDSVIELTGVSTIDEAAFVIA